GIGGHRSRVVEFGYRPQHDPASDAAIAQLAADFERRGGHDVRLESLGIPQRRDILEEIDEDILREIFDIVPRAEGALEDAMNEGSEALPRHPRGLRIAGDQSLGEGG